MVHLGCKPVAFLYSLSWWVDRNQRVDLKKRTPVLFFEAQGCEESRNIWALVRMKFGLLTSLTANVSCTLLMSGTKTLRRDNPQPPRSPQARSFPGQGHTVEMKKRPF